MATKRDIRTAMYSEFETATSGHLDPSDITMQYPSTVEDLPRVVHNYNFGRNQIQLGSSPKEVKRTNGNAHTLVYSRNRYAQFGLLVMADDESTKETIYTALVDHFEKFTTPHYDPSSIQADIHDISVLDTQQEDQTDREPVARGDRLQVRIEYEAFVEIDVDHIDSIDTGIDVDADDIDDIDYTIT